MTENDRSGSGSIPDARYNDLVERVEELEAGGGGDVPFVGVDPPPDPTDGMLWWDPDDNTPNGGSQPGTVHVEKITVGFADFGGGDGFGLVADVYTLQPGDVLLARGARVTEAFDDSTLVNFAFYDANLAQGDPWSFDPVPNVDPDGTGFVGLTSASLNTDATWGEQITMTMTDTVANGLVIYGQTMAGDGATGSIDVYVVVATGIA